jgi:hypothetical protein
MLVCCCQKLCIHKDFHVHKVVLLYKNKLLNWQSHNSHNGGYRNLLRKDAVAIQAVMTVLPAAMALKTSLAASFPGSIAGGE